LPTCGDALLGAVVDLVEKERLLLDRDECDCLRICRLGAEEGGGRNAEGQTRSFDNLMSGCFFGAGGLLRCGFTFQSEAIAETLVQETCPICQLD
jgi:hypothetical protein